MINLAFSSFHKLIHTTKLQFMLSLEYTFQRKQKQKFSSFSGHKKKKKNQLEQQSPVKATDIQFHVEGKSEYMRTFLLTGI
jgi:hypothetical protein